MKCTKCGTENKPEAKNCRKCGIELVVKPIWKPTWKWHARSLAIIYGVLIVVFIVMNILLRPYMRNLPVDITPWLKK